MIYHIQLKNALWIFKSTIIVSNNTIKNINYSFLSYLMDIFLIEMATLFFWT